MEVDKLIEVKKSKTEFMKRLTFTILLISLALYVIYSGPFFIMLAIVGIQVKCFNEIINIAYTVKKLPDNIPHFRLISWYLLSAANLYFYGENLATHFDVFIRQYYYVHKIFSYHRFIAFCMYLSGIVWFVLSIVRKYRLQQYSILAWTHMLLFVIGFQSYMVIENMFTGMIWLIMPIFLVVCNDIAAYVFGKFFGSTPLIEVSPKKTWEGFIGGAASTVIFGIVLSLIMCRFQYFVCPIKYVQTEFGIQRLTNCSVDYNFQWETYVLTTVPFVIEIQLFPFVFDSLALSLFASIVAPFGGFFASGFKRALKIKDFSDSIPGHGGFMDRFDCQYLMGTFINVYIATFMQSYNAQKVFQKILYLEEDDQLQFFHMLENSLKSRNMFT